VDCIFNRINCLSFGDSCIIYTVSTGIGTWGLNKNSWLGMGYHKLRLVGWYWSCRNFNFCAIIIPSAMENGINRSAEAMTIFSVIQAGLFPIIHGSSMVAYWVLPIQINLDLYG
jgi:molybdopterin-containing oxidoreductase family membrane subunit